MESKTQSQYELLISNARDFYLKHRKLAENSGDVQSIIETTATMLSGFAAANPTLKISKEINKIKGASGKQLFDILEQNQEPNLSFVRSILHSATQPLIVVGRFALR